jgi:rhodanese-related sulfurtransferase
MRTALILLDVMMALILSNAAIRTTPAQTGASPGKIAESAQMKRTHPDVPRIAALEVKQLIANKADIVIIDTQPAENYDMWHIATAVNIPYVSTGNPTDREMMLVALPMDKLIVLYCLCEEGTDSARMALELKRLGYDHDKVKVLEGGLVKWDEAGYPMIETEVPE